jgi:hypothetical protein
MATEHTEQQAELLVQFLEMASSLGLEDTSYRELQEDVREAVELSQIEDQEKTLHSLRAYRLIDADELEQHDYVRWLRASPDRPVALTKGGVVTSITEHDDGQHTVRCAGRTGRFFQVRTCPGVWLFKLLSSQEAVILNVLEALDQGSMLGQEEPLDPLA